MITEGGIINGIDGCKIDNNKIKEDAAIQCDGDPNPSLCQKNRIAQLTKDAEKGVKAGKDVTKEAGTNLSASASILNNFEANELIRQQSSVANLDPKQLEALKVARDNMRISGEKISTVANGLDRTSGSLAQAGAALVEIEGNSKGHVDCSKGRQAIASAITKAQALAAGKTTSAMEMMQNAKTGTDLMNGLKSLAGGAAAGKGSGNSGISGASPFSPSAMGISSPIAGSELGIDTGDFAGVDDIGDFTPSIAAAGSFSTPSTGEFKSLTDGFNDAGGISDKSATAGIAGSGASTGAIAPLGAKTTPVAKVLENTKGTDNIAAVEFGAGAGMGGRSSLLGLKSNSQDLDSLLGKDDEAAKNNFHTGLAGGSDAEALLAGRGIASVNDVNNDPEVSIFNVIRSKLMDMKKRGFL